MADKIGSVAIGVTADIDPLRKQFKKASKEVSGFGDVASKSAKAIASFSAAAIAAGGGLALMAKSASDSNRELTKLARLAGESANGFQRTAFASKQFGIEQEKLADILKDTQDKIGDFVETEGGAMKDFFENIAPKVGLTADQFKKLSGKDALQAYVSALEKANVTQSEMTFYMEALASDSTALVPLFANQGKELRRLESEYDAVNKQLQLTSGQRAGLSKLGESFDMMTTSAGLAGDLISATLAPTFNEFFSSVTSFVPVATQAIVDFFNTFIKAENLSSIAAVEKRITDSMERIVELEGNLNGKRGRSRNGVILGINKEKEELEQLKIRLEELTQAEKQLADARTFGGGGISASSRGGSEEENEENSLSSDFIESFLDPEILQEKNQVILDLDAQFWEMRKNIAAGGIGGITDLIESNYGTQAASMASSFSQMLSATATYSKKAFEINKKISLGNAVVKGYDAATSAWAAGMATGGPYAPLVAAAYTAASLAKTGAQIKAIKSQQFGGGGSGSAGGGTGGSAGAIAGASVPQAPSNTITTINLTGDTFSRDTVGALIGSINDALEDGYTLRLAS